MLQLGRLTWSAYLAVSFLNLSLVTCNVGHKADGCKKCSPMNEEDCYQGGSCRSAGTQQKCLEGGGEYCVTDFSCEDCVAKGETCFRKNWAEPCYSPTKAECTDDPLAEWCGKSSDSSMETGQAEAEGCKKCSPMNEENCYQGGSCRSAGTQQKCLEGGGEYCVTDFSCEDCAAKGETCFRKNWAEPCYSPTKAECTDDPLGEWCSKSSDGSMETGQAEAEGSEGNILLWSLVAVGTLALVSVCFSTHFYFSKSSMRISKSSMWTFEAPIDRETERKLDQLDHTLRDSKQSCCCRKSIVQKQKAKDSLLAQAALKAAGGPEFWSLSVREVSLFLEGHQRALMLYCKNHTLHITSDLVPQCWHMCHTPNCDMDHGDVLHAPSSTKADPLEANMHIVVSYLIKPMTNERVQPLVQGGKVARGILGMWAYLTERRIRRATTFVSHCWNEKFKDFVDTLQWLGADEAVWICSFALPQNINIGEVLGKKPSKSPFAQALRQSQQVLLAVDEKVEPPKRSWCCFELYLAYQQKKEIIIEQPVHGKDEKQFLRLRKHVAKKMKKVKLKECSASRQEDKENIMAEIGSHTAEVERTLAIAAQRVFAFQRLNRPSSSNRSPSISSDSLSECELV